MAFFNSAVDVLQTLVVALGAGLGIWGVINLMEGYGNDNPGAKSQGMKQLMAGGGVALIGSPEFGHNGNAVWGFISGITSGGMLALSMVCIHKTHQIEKTSLFPMMMILSFGGALSLIIPSILFDSHALYPATMRDIGLVLIYGAVMQCFAWGLIAYSIPMLSLSLTGLLLLSEPVAALLIDYFLLHKPINGLQWGGAALTLVAIYLGSQKPKP